MTAPILETEKVLANTLRRNHRAAQFGGARP